MHLSSSLTCWHLEDEIGAQQPILSWRCHCTKSVRPLKQRRWQLVEGRQQQRLQHWEMPMATVQPDATVTTRLPLLFDSTTGSVWVMWIVKAACVSCWTIPLSMQLEPLIGMKLLLVVIVLAVVRLMMSKSPIGGVGEVWPRMWGCCAKH